MKKKLLITLALALGLFAARAQTYEPTWESLDSRPVPQWYRDAKFGIFIHWGVYAVPAFAAKGEYAEWYQHALKSGDSATVNYQKKKFGDLSYYQMADQFRAELYNPDEWARIIAGSGARYVVLTSKHHDGFALWPSKEASRTWGFPWNAMEAGPHRDLLGDLFKALRKTPVHAGMYYSLYEWYNPLWLKDHRQYVAEHEWPQMKDVINTYHPDVFWTDGEWEESPETWKSKEFLAWLYNESPVKDKVVTYDRWGDGVRFKHGGVFTPEYQPDVSFADHYWEESRGMGYSYGYNRNEDFWDYNTPQALVLQLVDKVSGGGNFLLDIGPDEHGKIPPIMEERLSQIGDWMHLNQEAIYNTVRWRTTGQWGEGKRDYKPVNGGGDLLLKLTVDPDPGYAVKECFFTYNPVQNNLYAVLPQWPASNTFTIRDLTVSGSTRFELLENHQQLQWTQSGNDLLVRLPAFDPRHIRGQYAYVIKIAGAGAYAPATQPAITYPEGSLQPLVTVSEQEGCQYRYTLDGSTPGEGSALYTHPFFIPHTATLSIRSFKEGLLPGIVVSLPLEVFSYLPATHPSATAQGLKLSCYEGSLRSVSELKNIQPVCQTAVRDISTGDLTKTENAGLLYSGYIRVPRQALYRFYLSSDDGSQLWIDDRLVIDNDGLHANVEKTGLSALQQGLHRFRLAYIQDKSALALKLEYQTGKNARKPVPASFYYCDK